MQSLSKDKLIGVCSFETINIDCDSFFIKERRYHNKKNLYLYVPHCKSNTFRGLFGLK